MDGVRCHTRTRAGSAPRHNPAGASVRQAKLRDVTHVTISTHLKALTTHIQTPHQLFELLPLTRPDLYRDRIRSVIYLARWDAPS